LAFSRIKPAGITMYICVCKAVTDTQLRTAIDNGICTHRQLVHCFGVGKDCGKCNKDVKELLKERSHQQTTIYQMAVATH
jgi:bacterioferritin-associated ferredoxin